MALGALFIRPSELRLLAHRESWKTAKSDGNGQLTFNDGTTAQANVVPAGAAVVITADGASGEPYRGGTRPVELVVPGTVADVDRAVDEALTIRAVFALAAVTLGSAALAVAAVKGFVF